MFATWGRLIHRFRWATLVLSLFVLVASGLVLRRGGTLTNPQPSGIEAIRASDLINNELPHVSNGGSSFNLVVGSSALVVTDQRVRAALARALQPLRVDRRVAGIRTPYSVSRAIAATLISRDGKHALVTVFVKDSGGVARHYFPQLRDTVRSPTLDIVATGGIATSHAFDQYLVSDLRRAEVVSLPLALVLLLLVFGTVVAALLPLGVGVLSIVGGLAGVYLLTRVTDVSQYALNIVTLIGLGVAIDYSLFIVNRFREELGRGLPVPDALARALATAGRAVAFSGLTVAIGLAALLFYRGTFLASMGAAGTIVVAFAVFYGLTFLPALLAILGPRVNRWRLPLRWPGSGRGVWRVLAEGVMRRPIVVLVPTLAVVLLAGSPFLNLRLANGDVTALPPTAEVRRGQALLRNDFAGQEQTAIAVVVQYPDGHPLTRARVGALYDLSRRIARVRDVARVESPVDLRPGLGRSSYQQIYSAPRSRLPLAVRAALRQSVGAHIVEIVVLTNDDATSDAARAVVHAIRAQRIAGGQILVAGQTAFDIDSIDVIMADTPAALLFIMVMTYLVLFLLLGSVVLPLKAVVTDVLSISASFGALVWIFQQGHLSMQFNFTPAPLDPSAPILLFCIVFGLSMDYEVLLLSRIKEVYDETGDNRRAVAEGLQRSGRLITGAAAIMVVVFLAFALADTVIIKAIGFGLALAVAVDATLIRALVVPAVMRLLGDLNWWAPRPLARLYRRLSLGESLSPAPDAAQGKRTA